MHSITFRFPTFKFKLKSPESHRSLWGLVLMSTCCLPVCVWCCCSCTVVNRLPQVLRRRWYVGFRIDKGRSTLYILNMKLRNDKNSQSCFDYSKKGKARSVLLFMEFAFSTCGMQRQCEEWKCTRVCGWGHILERNLNLSFLFCVWSNLHRSIPTFIVALGPLVQSMF